MTSEKTRSLRLSTEAFLRAKRVSPGGVHSPVRAFRKVGGTPCFMRSARGSRIEDIDGNSFVDYCMSWGPMILGHRDPEVEEAIHRAVEKGWSFGAAEEGSLELAELINREIPWVEKIRFVSTGTEAVMSALRVARAATGRSVILKFDGCYHGHADSMLVRAGSGLAEMAEPDSAGVSQAVAAETLVVPLGDSVALEAAFEQHGSQIAAAIIEPVPANNGLLLQRPDFLSQLRKLTEKSQALLIFDEVITGFRVAFGGMAQVAGVRPDLVTYGKILGGGFPVAAYGGRSDLMEWVAPVGPVYQAGTLSAQPVAIAAGLATLQKLKRTDPYLKLAKFTGTLARTLEGLKGEKGTVRVPSFGSIFWLTIEKSERFSEFFHFLLDKGVYLSPSPFEVCFTSTAHTDDDRNLLIESVKKWLE